MRRFRRLMLGKQSVHAEECFSGDFVGTDYDIDQDLSEQLPDHWRSFNDKFIPIFLEQHPDKTRISAGLSCAQLWVVSKGIEEKDVVLCPDGDGQYRFAEITGGYYHAADQVLPHRRPVQWFGPVIPRSDMSEALRWTCVCPQTVVELGDHIEELEGFLSETRQEPVFTDTTFALEKHLEDFLVSNWHATELSHDFSLYEDDGEIVGQQYPTDTGPIDLLAISRDLKTILVIELKRGRASDKVVAQIFRYMGYVRDELAGPEQSVRGLVIALGDDQGLRRALSMVPSIEFKRYEVSFRLLAT